MHTDGHSRYFYPKGSFIAFLLVFAISCFCYLNSLNTTFVSDDYYIIQLNRDTLSWQGIVNCFTSSDSLVLSHLTPYYRPLTRLLFVVEHHFFGMNAVSYHVVTILLHAVTSGLLLLTALRLGCSLLPSFLGALLFALHPIHSEAVNLLAARNNILATLFVLGSYLAFAKADETGSKRGYLCSGVLFGLGLLCKETAAVFLPFLFYLKTLRGLKLTSAAAALKANTAYLLPHTVFLCIYLVLRHLFLGKVQLAGLSHRLWQLVYIFPKYLNLLLFPSDQSFHYTIPGTFAPVAYPLVFGWLAIAALVWYAVKVRSVPTRFGFAWLVMNLVPICNIIPIPSCPLADRYLYLPLVGAAIMVADGIQRACARRTAGRIAVPLTAVAIALCGTMTWQRNAVWRDELSLAASMVRTEPARAEGHYELGTQYFLLGDSPLARGELEASLRLNPRFSQAAWAYYYLAVADLARHDARGAMRQLQRAESADCTRPQLHYLLASLYQKDRDASSREYKLFLAAASSDCLELIPEAKSALIEAGAEKPPAQLPLLRPHPSWKTYHLFASGSEASYDPASVKVAAGGMTLSAGHRLTRRDRLPYLMSFISFPLGTLAEIRYDFEVKCPLHLYKTTRVDFLDNAGTTLGTLDPQKEYYLQFAYTYPPPGTAMDTLLNEVCAH